LGIFIFFLSFVLDLLFLIFNFSVGNRSFDFTSFFLFLRFFLCSVVFFHCRRRFFSILRVLLMFFSHRDLFRLSFCCWFGFLIVDWFFLLLLLSCFIIMRLLVQVFGRSVFPEVRDG